MRESFDVYKAGLDILVGAGFPILCSFNFFFTLGWTEITQNYFLTDSYSCFWTPRECRDL